MTWESWTALVFIVGLVFAVLWDILAYVRGGDRATFSKICLSTANKYRGFAIVFAFVVGVLFGHLFLAQHITTSSTQSNTSK